MEHQELLRQVEAMQETVSTLTALAAQPIRPVSTPKTSSKSRNPAVRHAVACAMFSDWHIEETVEPEKVNGLNEYNLRIAQQRVDRVVDGYLWLLDLCRQRFSIDTGLIWLGGDLFSGYIHEELVETAACSPIESILKLYDILVQVLPRIVEQGNLERLIVPCSVGNHGRTTQKRRVATRHENSYEWLLYSMLARTFAGSKIEVSAPKSALTYVHLYGTKLRFTHGDQIRYEGGIGGLTIPATKKVLRWNSGRFADVTCIGHHHQYRATHDLVVNGSLIGVTPYALEIGAAYEPPQQAFFLVDSAHGLCLNTPIWAEGGEYLKRIFTASGLDLG